MKRPPYLLLALALLLLLPSCAADKRIQRQASYINTVTRVTKKERDAAKTVEEKAAIGDKYFERIPKHTQLLEDYLHGREPSTPSPKALKKAEKAKAEAKKDETLE